MVEMGRSGGFQIDAPAPFLPLLPRFSATLNLTFCRCPMGIGREVVFSGLHNFVHHQPPNSQTPMHFDEPATTKPEPQCDFDTFIPEFECRPDAMGVDAQINDIFNEFNDIILAANPAPNTASETSPTDLSPFEPNEHSHSSISSENTPTGPTSKHHTTSVDVSTIAAVKRAMADTSRLIGTFTILKTTYLKLCKEFNYLLGKFNENEKIKIELIHENNQLRKLLVDTIKEKELDRKKYKADLDLLTRA